MPAYIAWADGAFRFDAVLSESHNLDSEVTTHPVESGLEISDNVRPLPKVITITGIISQTPIYQQAFGGLVQQVLDTYNPNFPISAVDRPSPTTITLPAAPAITSLNAAFNALQALQAGTFNVQYAFTGNTNSPPTVTVGTYSSDQQNDYIGQAYSALRTLQENATLLTVFGGGGLGGSPGVLGGPRPKGETGSQSSTSMFENMILKTISFDRAQGAGGSANFTITLHEIRIVNSSVVAAPQPTIVTAQPVKSTGNQATTTPVKKKSILRQAATGQTPSPGVTVE